MIGSGLRSVSQARSSTCSLGSGCSTITTFFSFSQCSMSSATARSFHPWLTSAVMGVFVTERMVSMIIRSVSRPSLTFRTLYSAASLVFCRTTSCVSMPMVNDVYGVLRASNPQMLYHGCFISRPSRSCRAMSTDALAAEFPDVMASMSRRMVSSSKGFSYFERSTRARKSRTDACDSPR